MKKVELDFINENTLKIMQNLTIINENGCINKCNKKTWGGFVGNENKGKNIPQVIDGWREADGRSKAAKNEKRLDYIFCNTQADVRTSNVICNGKNAPVVSDHYGVMITV